MSSSAASIALVRDVVLADEAEDRGVERRDVPFPIGKGAVRDLRAFRWRPQGRSRRRRC